MKTPETDFIKACTKARKLLSLPKSTASTQIAQKARERIQQLNLSITTHELTESEIDLSWSHRAVVNEQLPYSTRIDGMGLSETEAVIRLFLDLYGQSEALQEECFMRSGGVATSSASSQWFGGTDTE